MKRFAKRFQKLRKSRGITIQELGKEIDICIPVLKHWENGELVLKVSDLVKISKYFGVTVDYLIGL